MHITLKNVRVYEGMSEETICFSATVYADGKKLTCVRNDGHGGCNRYDDWNAIKEVDAYAKSLPPVIYEFGDDGQTVVPRDVDDLVDNALRDYLLCKEIKKATKTRLIVLMPDGTLMQGRKVSPVEIAHVTADEKQLSAIVSRWGGVACFNTMPLQDQVKAWIHNSEA